MKYLATLFITILILVAVLLPGSKIPSVGFSGIDKVAHFTLFYLWSLAVRFDFSQNFKWVIAFLVGLMFSYLTEVLQLFVEGRAFDYYDMITDSIGLSVGLMTGNFILKIIIRLWPFGKKD
jgi:VanZ family protein